jgi:pimeloyl-ACP methyl ester carboxylesterase
MIRPDDSPPGKMRLPSLLLLGLALLAPTVRAAPGSPSTYVIVHGAWGGGWAFQEVDRLLTADGHKVYRPTLTGQGERVHLSSPDVGLSTHIEDIVNLILWENLHEVVLVGHSYGGMVITGVADRVPDRIKRLIYLDAFLPENGESVNTAGGLSMGLGRNVVEGFIPPTWVHAGAPIPHDVPMPARTFSEPILLTHQEAARRIPTRYFMFLPKGHALSEGAFYRFYQRAQARGWPVATLESDHNAQWSHPREEVALLEDAAR